MSGLLQFAPKPVTKLRATLHGPPTHQYILEIASAMMLNFACSNAAPSIERSPVANNWSTADMHSASVVCTTAPGAAEAVTPELAAPELVAPDAVAPEHVASEAVAPEHVAPEAVAPELDAPEAVALEAVAPEAVAPELVADDVEPWSPELLDADIACSIPSSSSWSPSTWTRASLSAPAEHPSGRSIPKSSARSCSWPTFIFPTKFIRAIKFGMSSSGCSAAQAPEPVAMCVVAGPPELLASSAREGSAAQAPEPVAMCVVAGAPELLASSAREGIGGIHERAFGGGREGIGGIPAGGRSLELAAVAAAAAANSCLR